MLIVRDSFITPLSRTLSLVLLYIFSLPSSLFILPILFYIIRFSYYHPTLLFLSPRPFPFSLYIRPSSPLTILHPYSPVLYRPISAAPVTVAKNKHPCLGFRHCYRTRRVDSSPYHAPPSLQPLGLQPPERQEAGLGVSIIIVKNTGCP